MPRPCQPASARARCRRTRRGAGRAAGARDRPGSQPRDAPADLASEHDGDRHRPEATDGSTGGRALLPVDLRSSSGGEPRSSQVPSALRTIRPLSSMWRSAVVTDARRQPTSWPSTSCEMRSRSADAVRGHVAPALGEVPEQHEQPGLHRRELEQRLVDRHPLVAPHDALEHRAHHLRPGRQLARERAVEDGQPRPGRARASARGSGPARPRGRGPRAGARRPRRAARWRWCRRASGRGRAGRRARGSRARPGRRRRSGPPSGRSRASHAGRQLVARAGDLGRRARAARARGRPRGSGRTRRLRAPAAWPSNTVDRPPSIPFGNLPVKGCKPTLEFNVSSFPTAPRVAGIA